MHVPGNTPDVGADVPTDDDLPTYPAPDYTLDDTGAYVELEPPQQEIVDRPADDFLAPSHDDPDTPGPEQGLTIDAPDTPEVADSSESTRDDTGGEPPLLLLDEKAEASQWDDDWGFAAEPATPRAQSLADFGWDEAPEVTEESWQAEPQPDLFEPPRATDTSSLPWFLQEEPTQTPDEAEAAPEPAAEAPRGDDVVAVDEAPPPNVADEPVAVDVPTDETVVVDVPSDEAVAVEVPTAEPVAVEVPTAEPVVGDSPVEAWTDDTPEAVVDEPPAPVAVDPWFVPDTPPQPPVAEPAAGSAESAGEVPTETQWFPPESPPAAEPLATAGPVAAAPAAVETPLEPAPPPEKTKKGKEPPSPADIASVGVAILPGVPLPDWVAPPPSEVAEWTGAPVAAPPVAVLPSGELPPPDPAQWSEHPWGPVVWGVAAPVAGAVAASPVVDATPETPEPGGVTVLPPEQPEVLEVVDVSSPPATDRGTESVDPDLPVVDGPPPPTEMPVEPTLPPGDGSPPPTEVPDEFGWLYEPDVPAPTPAGPEDESPEPAPMGPPVGPPVALAASLAAPPTGDPVLPDPGEGTPLDELPRVAEAEPSPSPETVAPAIPDASAPVASPDVDASADDDISEDVPGDDQPDPPGKRTSGAMKWILIIGGALIVLAGAAYAAFVTPGFLNSTGTPAPATLATPAQAGGLTKTGKPAEPANGVFTSMAAAEKATGSQIATYSGDGTVATAWVATDAVATPDSLIGAYEVSDGAPVKEWVNVPAGPRGGSMKCGAVSASQTVCVWAGDGVVGAVDVTGMGRAQSATLAGQMRLALEQPATT
ncbi:MAG: hypothetical protein U0R64_03465 [Candidatus Nanopelagicales bacterium]